MKFPNAILNFNKYIYELIAIFIIVLICFVEYSLNERINFSLMYLVPISLIVLLVGKIEGLVLSVISSLGFVFVDYLLNGWSNINYTTINASLRFGIFVCFVILISSLKESRDKETLLARKDSLTGVSNGRGFYEDAEYHLSKANRENGVLTLLYLDIDNFKTVNDTLGHNEGDRLLKHVASTIENSVRSIDTVTRLGGDEFAVLFPGIDGDIAKKTISRIKEILDEQIFLHHWPITFSIGVVTFLELPSSVDEMIKVADERMYSVKYSGKNNISYFIYPS